jgi:hypothetical protein
MHTLKTQQILILSKFHTDFKVYYNSCVKYTTVGNSNCKYLGSTLDGEKYKQYNHSAPSPAYTRSRQASARTSAADLPSITRGSGRPSLHPPPPPPSLGSRR